ncbi:MAG: glycogen/starch synthase [Oscillospiraceae bacterium]|nr:glycogen/starch synthase [Oscillospiraceae bacterium]
MNRKHYKLLKELGRDSLPPILIAASECAPLSKTGGLADVAGALPKALARLGFDTRVITPYHQCIKDKYFGQTEHLCDFTVTLGWRQQYAGIEKLVVDGVTFYLVDNEFYYGDQIYRGGDEEVEQYAFFSRAVLEAIPRLDFAPEVLHCNDWQCAIMPMLIKTQYGGKPQGSLKTLLTIHNLAFQGVTSFGFLQSLLGIDPMFMTTECLEYYGQANQLKAGIIFADRVNTVSPNYAAEIRTEEYGCGLQGVLEEQSYKLSGIVNGLDYKVFNPWTDPNLTTHYSAKKLSGRAKCRAALCEALGLDISPETPIIAMVTRMTDQKGFDLVMQVMEPMLEMGAAFVLLGSGNWNYEQFMRQAEYSHKGTVVAYIGYNATLANQIYAGSDFYLMPSRFEPCGLSQMIAMRYGCIPIVRATGGLKDTVQHFDGKNGTGFVFEHYDCNGLLWAVGQAMEAWQDKDKMNTLIRNAMTQDFSFAVSAEAYADLFLEMIQ